MRHHGAVMKLMQNKRKHNSSVSTENFSAGDSFRALQDSCKMMEDCVG